MLFHAAKTLTFLCTEIESSTQRWQRVPDEMAAALCDHDAQLSTAVERHTPSPVFLKMLPRIMYAGHGGQILLSDATFALLSHLLTTDPGLAHNILDPHLESASSPLRP